MTAADARQFPGQLLFPLPSFLLSCALICAPNCVFWEPYRLRSCIYCHIMLCYFVWYPRTEPYWYMVPKESFPAGSSKAILIVNQTTGYDVRRIVNNYTENTIGSNPSEEDVDLYQIVLLISVLIITSVWLWGSYIFGLKFSATELLSY